MIFAREISDNLTSLVKKIDEATAENKSNRMGSFVVFLSNDEGLEQKLKDLATKEGLKHTNLTIDNAAGPRGSAGRLPLRPASPTPHGRRRRRSVPASRPLARGASIRPSVPERRSA